MGQILHKCAKTTERIRVEIQQSKESIQKIAKRYNVNPKTVINSPYAKIEKFAQML